MDKKLKPYTNIFLHFMKKHLKSTKELLLQIILIWVLPTTTSVWCMTTWVNTGLPDHPNYSENSDFGAFSERFPPFQILPNFEYFSETYYFSRFEL